jgi:hypothetical protein
MASDGQGVRVPAGARDFLSYKTFQTDSGAHSAAY